MKLNLSGVKRTIESLMDDTATCEITRDAEGTGDDIWDPVAGTYTPPPADTELIYEGSCMIGNRGGGADMERGGRYITESPCMISIPIDAPELMKKDRVLVTYSKNDPGL